ncbi:hypothetical protein OG698_28410 [Streptomyces sp. NBC_01003]|uniref:hypothetical protein n=1 Tax=Streptomyces sp. NBC_01003 TaxID=2903714 RepID=UPI003868244D|nr:hypothetical protein OG698_28410 [Streptomyces sp. NBC_01003]
MQPRQRHLSLSPEPPPTGGDLHGDTLCAVDDRSDGYYVKGILTTGRTVSTNGKPSPGSDRQGGPPRTGTTA